MIPESSRGIAHTGPKAHSKGNGTIIRSLVSLEELRISTHQVIEKNEVNFHNQ